MKPGSESIMAQLFSSYGQRDVPGFIQEYVYRTDKDSNEYFMAVLFRDRESYFANANSPEMNEVYLKFRELLEADPEWNDGEIIYPLMF